MDTFMYLIAFCVVASLIAIWVGTSERHHKASRLSEFTASPKEPADQAHRLASGTKAKRSERRVMLLVICSFCLSSALGAQEVIHAVSGTVGSVNAVGKTITLMLDDGSSRQFKQMPGSAKSMSFNKTLQAQSIAATELHQLGQHVIMFFYGYDDHTTAIAFIDLGQDASKPITGSITQYDRHQHLLVVKSSGVQPQEVTFNQNTVIDTAGGAVDGLSYHPAKGERVLVVTAFGGTVQTALFISPFE